MAYDEALAGRVRDCLSDIETTEKKMFGGLAFMTGGHLTVGVYGDGLIARVGAEGIDAAVAEPGVRPFDMTGRPMRGIVVVAPAPPVVIVRSGISDRVARSDKAGGPPGQTPPDHIRGHHASDVRETVPRAGSRRGPGGQAPPR